MTFFDALIHTKRFVLCIVATAALVPRLALPPKVGLSNAAKGRLVPLAAPPGTDAPLAPARAAHRKPAGSIPHRR
jgi:hypothetical protein